MGVKKLSLTKGKSNKSLELDLADFDVDEVDDWNEFLKVKVQRVLNHPENYESITLIQVESEDVKAILKVCGSETKEFIWEHVEDNEASEVIEILNLMPKLESFTYDDNSYGPKISGIEEVEVKLNLPNLKTLSISCKNSIYKLLKKVLPENSITEHSCYSICDSDEKSFREFVAKQKKSIKKLSAYVKLALMSIKMFELEHLQIFLEIPWTEDLDDALSSQQKLKTLHMRAPNLGKCIDGICKLSQLETLKIEDLQTCTAADAKKLKKIKILKELEFINSPSLNFWGNFLGVRHLNLQKLTLSSIGRTQANFTAEILENLPNLVYLSIEAKFQKFNTFAKFLPNLEELHMKCDDENLNLCEFDTGIVSKSLKKVHVEILWLNRVEEVLEIFEICPNLEELKLDDVEIEEKNYNGDEEAAEKFFKRLNEVKNLKALSLSEIWLKDYPNFYPQLAEGLKKVSTKLKFAEIKFSDRVEEGENRHEALIEMLKEDYEIEVKII